MQQLGRGGLGGKLGHGVVEDRKVHGILLDGSDLLANGRVLATGNVREALGGLTIHVLCICCLLSSQLLSLQSQSCWLRLGSQPSIGEQQNEKESLMHSRERA